MPDSNCWLYNKCTWCALLGLLGGVFRVKNYFPTSIHSLVWSSISTTEIFTARMEDKFTVTPITEDREFIQLYTSSCRKNPGKSGPKISAATWNIWTPRSKYFRGPNIFLFTELINVRGCNGGLGYWLLYGRRIASFDHYSSYVISYVFQACIDTET